MRVVGRGTRSPFRNLFRANWEIKQEIVTGFCDGDGSDYDHVCVRRSGLSGQSLGLLRVMLLPADDMSSYTIGRALDWRRANASDEMLSESNERVVAEYMYARCTKLLADEPGTDRTDRATLARLTAQQIAAPGPLTDVQYLTLLTAQLRIEERDILRSCVAKYKAVRRADRHDLKLGVSWEGYETDDI